MAKRLHEEDIKLNIIVGNNQAQKKIYDLEQANRKYAESNKDLEKQMKAIPARLRATSEEYKRMGREIASNNKQIEANKLEIRGLTDTLDTSSMTMRQLSARAKELRMMLRNMVPGTGTYNQLNKELSTINARMSELNGRARAQQLTWSSAANWLNKYQTLLISVAASLTGVVFTFQKWLDYAGELSDQQANVMKTTQMTKQEVDALTKSFGELETRTSRIDLLKIAEEGGRIGIAKDEMADFVTVMDRAAVALGDSFTGGVEEVASVLGKLKFVFEETKDLGVDEAYNAIGSAINDLGANGVATEKNIAEFATRLGSLPNNLKPSIAEALALGAAFEESGIEAEVSARAYSIFLNRASTNTAEFAKIMGVSRQEAEAMINANPVEFFLKFGESLKKSNVSATQMSKLLQDMGINADGANKIVGAISNNTDRFRKLIDLSNKSMADGTSLTNEYNLQNQTLGATLDKIQKTVTGWMSSDTLVDWLTMAVRWFAKFIGATEDADGSVERWRERLVTLAKIIAVVIAALVSYRAVVLITAKWTQTLTVATKLLELAQTRAVLVTNLLRSASLLLASAKAFLTGNVTRAAAAMRLFNMTVRANPLGLLLSVLAAAAAAMWAFSENSEKAGNAQEYLNKKLAETSKEISSSISETASEINKLISIIKDENIQIGIRKKAYEDLIKIAPEFNGYLQDEKFNIQGLTAAYSNYIKNLQAVGRAKSLLKANQEIVDEEMEAWLRLYSAQQKVAAIELKMAEERKKNSRGISSAATIRENKIAQDELKEAQLAYEFAKDASSTAGNAISSRALELQNSINFLRSKLQEAFRYMGEDAAMAMQEYKDIAAQLKSAEAELKLLTNDPSKNSNTVEQTGDYSFSPSSPKTTTTTKTDKAKSDRQKRIDEIIAENQKLSEDLLAIRQANEDAQLEIQEEGFAKEYNQLQIEKDRKIAALKQQIIDEETLQKLRNERSTASKSGDTQKVGLLDDMISSIEQKNAELNNSIIQMELTTEYKLGALHGKFANQRLSNLIDEFDARKKQREQGYKEEVVALGSTEAIKERLKSTLSQRELDQIKTWEDAKAALKAEYDKEEIDDQIQHVKDLIEKTQDAIANGVFEGFDIEFMPEADKEAFLAQIEELKAELIDLGVVKAGLKGGTSGTGNSEDFSTPESYGMGNGVEDLLGMTPETWDSFINNLKKGKFELEELNATVGLLQNAFQSYYALVQANEQRNLSLFEQNANRKRTALDRQLKQGIISQEQYDRKLQKLNEETDRKRAKMEYEAAMRAWKMNLGNAIVSAAMATLNGFNTTPFMPLGIIMGALAATLGTLQVATVMKNKPVKGYEKGLYPVIREQDGKYFDAEYGGETRSGMVNKPTLYLAGERGPEMIIDNQAFRQFAPGLKQDLFREIGRVKGFENGYYPSQPSTSTGNSEMVEELLKQNIALMAQNNALLQQMNDKESRAYMVLDFEEIKKLEERRKEYETHVNKNKR